MQDAERLGASASELRIVPCLCPLDISPYNYSLAESLISQAKSLACQWIESGGLERAEVPEQLREHQH